MFLNVSMSMRSFWWIQLYLNLFQDLLSIIYFIWYTAKFTMNEHVYLLTSQRAKNYEAPNVFLNLLLGARTIVYQKT